MYICSNDHLIKKKNIQDLCIYKPAPNMYYKISIYTWNASRICPITRHTFKSVHLYNSQHA